MIHDNLLSLLVEAGLNDKEAKVYLACMELGGASVGDVAQKAEIKRTSVYNFLDEMKKKGFISEIQRGNKSFLVAEDPRVIAGKMEDRTKRIREALPEFSALFNGLGKKPNIRYYEGEEGLRSIYEDTLTTEEAIYEISDYEKMFDVMDREWAWNYPKRRSAKKIQAYSIARTGPLALEVKSKDREHLRETRLAEKVDFETEINIYGDKVAMLSFRAPLSGVIIEDAAIAQTLRSMWKIIWNSLEK